MEEKGKKKYIEEKNYPIGTYRLTWAVDRKHFFSVWPNVHR